MKLAELVLVGLASGCLSDAMTGPRRIERQGRSQEGSPVDWEFGGWRPLQTPKGFYRRISRNLFKDDENRLLNEVGLDGDLEASSSSSKFYQAQALEDFLKAGPECGGCGFQPMIFHSGAGRRARSASVTQTLDTPQRLGSYKDDIIHIADALKQKQHERNIRKRGKRDANQISGSTDVVTSSTDSEPSGMANNEELDQAKVDNISHDDDEPHFLSPKALLDLSKKIAQAIVAKQSTSHEPTSTPTSTPTATPTSTPTATTTLNRYQRVQRRSDFVNEAANAYDKTHQLASVENVSTIDKKTLAAASAVLKLDEQKAVDTKTPLSTPDSQGEPHFLSPGAIHAVLMGIAEAAGKPEHAAETKRPNEVRYRMKRQIWNPFRRRQPNSKPTSGPYGFVNQNIPYEAQSSIDNFNFAQSISQNPYQSNGFQVLQPFGSGSHSPPITNFDKVSSIEFAKPLSAQEFTPQFVPEPVVIAPVPTRPVKRPEPAQHPKPSVLPPPPPPSLLPPPPPPPPPQMIDEILSQFQRTGQFPPDLSRETALLIAEILSGKKHLSPADGAVAPVVDTQPSYVEAAKPTTTTHREAAPLPDFHTKPLSSRPVSFGSLPGPPSKSSFYESSRNKPLPSLSGTKVLQAEKAAEHSVESDHPASIFPQEHVHVHHHHKKKKKRPSVSRTDAAPAVVSAAEIPLTSSEHLVSELHQHHSHQSSHGPLVNAKVHLDTKPSHGPALSLEAELGADTKAHPVTVDPLQTIDEAPSEKPSVNNAEYYDEIFNRKTTSSGSTTTLSSQWPVDDPFLNPTTSTEGPHTVGPEDILIQDAKPGIPLMASDLNSLKTKTKFSGPGESVPQPVFRPDIQTKKATEAAKQATQDEDDISAGAGAIHFQPIQTKEGEANSATGNAQLYHAYYAPAHHDPPAGYIRMTVDEFNKLFKDAEIQFIGSEQELQNKLGTKPTNKLNFDITKEAKDEEKDTSDVKVAERDAGKDTEKDAEIDTEAKNVKLSTR